MRKTLLALLSFSVITTFLFTASASGPVFWRVNTRAEVEKGDAVGVSIADNGAITLAPALAEVFDTKQAYIWAAAADNSGNVYLGTGHEGRVFKVDATGKGSLLYKTSELDVMALAVDAGGNVYAGTSPDGKVYRITPNGEAKVFFEPKTKYIWSLAFDAQGRLLVGTGDKGIIFRVNADGTGAPLVNTTQTNITALKMDGAGNIIAGTDPGGMVLRISADGKAFTLFDSAQREIRDLAVGRNGEIYALALAESAGSGSSNAASASSSASPAQPIDDGGGVTIVISDVQTIDSPASAGGSSSSSASSGGGSSAKSALYRVNANGAADTVWESKDAAAFAVALDANGQALIGTGQKGRIYSVTAGQKPGLLAQTSEAQTSRFVRAGNQTYVAASNLGKLFKLGGATAATGTYTSSVREAATTAAWGRISWIGEGAIELQTRSGNTTTPDSTWSDWSAAITNADGDAIKSPSTRFLQWRATLKRSAASSPAPRLREVTVSYLPRNVAPKINSLNFLSPGIALIPLPQPIMEGGGDVSGEGSAPISIPPRRVPQRGAISIQWQAEDRNGDSIEYSVFYRAANSTEFYPLKANAKENYFTIDPNALPDGRYVFKVVATDAPSNPASLALTDEQETESVDVDNSPPTVSADAPRVSGGNAEVTFRASDSTSIIKRAEYQLDGGAWKAVFPADGIADSKREEFLVKVALPDARSHVVAFRVFDANSNVGSAQVPVGGK
ncbi:MAG: hypothetical protein SF097_03260 [Acidobacteriota bacterium]|nr:hypothetical protein [Acidobacteriota bacterium]